MRAKLPKTYLILLMFGVWGLTSRAQQAPPLVVPNGNGTSSASSPTNTAAMASISGTVSNGRTGEPLRKASVTLRQISGGGRGGGNNGPGGGGRGGNNGNGQGPNANAQLGQQALAGALPGGAAAGGGQNNQGGQGGQGGRGGGGQNQNFNNQNQNGNGGRGGNNQVTTGDDGTYVFNNVNPGQYQVVVDRDGFISQEYGQRSWVSGTGATLTIAAGQKLVGINIGMTQAGTISGRIRDENGEAVAGIQVLALSYQYQSGTKTLVTARQVLTDDLGAYRLYWLTPGNYYISAIPNGPGGRRGQGGQNFANVAQAAGLTQVAGLINATTAGPAVDEAYAPTYYPGSYDPENAIPVNLPQAQDVGGMDFIVRPIQMWTVSGKVTAIDLSSIPLTPAQQQAQQRQQQQQAQQGNRGGRGGNNNNNNGNNNNGGRGNNGRGNQNFGCVNVILTRIGPTANTPGGGRGGRGGGGGGGGRGGGFGGFGGPDQPRATVNPDGTFQIRNVIPGSYNLTAIQQGAGQIFSARTRVEVNSSNLSNINLAVAAGINITGQIAPEDGKVPSNFRLNNVQIRLVPTEDVPLPNTQVQAQADGTFTLNNVQASAYRLNFSGISGGYVIGARFANVDVANEPMQVDPGQAGATMIVQVGFQPGTVTGDVSDDKSQPYQAATCVLVPNARNRLDLYKTASSDQNGKFTFSNVAPGDYKLFAWESVPSGAYQDASYLRPYEDKGKAVTIGKSASVPVQVNIIPASAQ